MEGPGTWNDIMVYELGHSLEIASENATLSVKDPHVLKEWLLDHPESDWAIPSSGESPHEPALVLIRSYQRLTRAASQLLALRGLALCPPALGSNFADTAVSSLLREAYFDVDVAVELALRGLDVQTATIMRHLLDVFWKAMVLVEEPEQANKMADVAFAGSYSSHKRAAATHWKELNPGSLLSEVIRIEVELDGVPEDEKAEAIAKKTADMKRLYYDWLSNVAHGGGYMVMLSTFRSGTGQAKDAPLDPFEAIGRPTARGIRDLSLLLSTVWRFWNYFPRILMPGKDDTVPVGTLPPASAELDAEAEMLRSGVYALNNLMERHEDLLWQHDQNFDDDNEWDV